MLLSSLPAVCVGVWGGRSADPAADLAAAWSLAAGDGDPAAAELEVDATVAVEGVADGVDEPGVERLPGLGRGLLGARLDRLREPRGDARLAGVLGLRRGRRRGRAGRADRGGGLELGHHELGLAPVQPYVDGVV